VRKTCNEKLGIAFDDWQEQAGRVMLAKRDDGNLAAMIDGVGLSLPRQVGKTYLVGAMVFALSVNMPGLLVIWSAHHARTHGETFLAMQGFADRSKVKPYVRQVFTGSGDEEIRFHNGSRILFGARERGFGRGIPGVDILIFDEAQILSDRALSNMLATMNTSRFGLQLYIGTPPKPEDMSESFTRMRKEALEGTLHDGAWIELGADKGASPDDRKQWAKANPSYPTRTPVQSIMRLKRKLTPADFLREGMGVWDDGVGTRPLVMPNWPLCSTTAEPAEPAALGIALDEDRVWLSCGLATKGLVPHIAPVVSGRTERILHVRMTDPTFGRAEFVAEVARIQREINVPVVMDSKDPSETLEAELKAAGVNVEWVGLDDVIGASADLYDAVEAKQVTHGDYEDLNTAVRNAGKRKVGQRWLFARESGEISMLKAVSLASWGASQNLTTAFFGGWR
jgi:hypothetical protein